MPKAMVQISDKANRILNILKAKYTLKDKSQAINKMAEEFGEILLEPQLRPEYIKRALRIQKQPSIKVGTVENLRKRYE